ncbi:c-type cytochrome [Oceanisphaera avium]|nr:c-type cytochrome [Oceanisphaera avium]
MHKTTLALLLLTSMTGAHAQLRVDDNSTTEDTRAQASALSATTEEPATEQKSAAKKDTTNQHESSAKEKDTNNNETTREQAATDNKEAATTQERDAAKKNEQAAKKESTNKHESAAKEKDSTNNDSRKPSSSDNEKRSTNQDVKQDRDSSNDNEKAAKKDITNKQDSSAKEKDTTGQEATNTSGSTNKEADTDQTAKQSLDEQEPSQKDKGKNKDKKNADSKTSQQTDKRDLKESTALIKNAAKRGTPPWTNDSANIHLQLSRGDAEQDQAKPYQAEDFKIKPEWERWFAGEKHFSTQNGKEVYEVLCQACHMPDGQGAQGAGHFPSFVGNERLRSPDYPIAVILNGLRGMPPFSEMLSDQQVAEVVNHLRTNFGNQLDGDTTAEEVAKVRQDDSSTDNDEQD